MGRMRKKQLRLNARYYFDADHCVDVQHDVSEERFDADSKKIITQIGESIIGKSIHWEDNVMVNGALVRYVEFTPIEVDVDDDADGM